MIAQWERLPKTPAEERASLRAQRARRTYRGSPRGLELREVEEVRGKRKRSETKPPLGMQFLVELQESDKPPEEVFEKYVKRRMRRGYSRQSCERYFTRVLEKANQYGGYY